LLIFTCSLPDLPRARLPKDWQLPCVTSKAGPGPHRATNGPRWLPEIAIARADKMRVR
jgi:hypothetical protein